MMETHERRRHDLFTKLAEVLGSDEAETLMEYLPPWSWPEIATKSDLEALARELRGEMSSLRHELRGEMAEVRGEMAEVRGEMREVRGEMAGVHGEIAKFRGELVGSEGRLHEQIAKQTRLYVFATLSAVLAAAAIAFGAAGLT